jgi:FixJ family two-component response regulator
MRKGIASEPTVFILDDGEGEFGEAARILRAAGFAVHTLSAPSVAAERSWSCRSACVLLDLHRPGFDPLQLPGALAKAGCPRRWYS